MQRQRREEWRAICSRVVLTMTALLVFVCAQRVNAGIFLSSEQREFERDSGVQTLAIFARSDSADQIISFATDIRLGAGVFETPPGTFMQSGQIGFGSTGSSLFTRSSDRLASLSLDFVIPSAPNNAQLFPSSNSSLATIRFNVNGLVPGTYSVGFENTDALAVGGNAVAIGSSAGSFRITAVPEPSSFLLFTSVSMIIIARFGPELCCYLQGCCKHLRRRHLAKPSERARWPILRSGR
jgi:hypothetical protein